jgi:hypothetical protein
MRSAQRTKDGRYRISCRPARPASSSHRILFGDVPKRSRCPIVGVRADKKLFDLFAVGLISKSKRGDWTPLELFIGGFGDTDAGLRRALFHVVG